MKNHRGQALVESMMTMPVFVGLLVALSLSSVNSLFNCWADYWVYQGALCLASDASLEDCRQQLKRQLTLFPAGQFEAVDLWRSASTARVQVRGSFFGYQSTFRETLRIPLSAQDFRTQP